MTLFRPTGLAELRLVARSGWKNWPPRLPEQPIFYPVLNFDYAAHIAREWNTKTDEFAGFVTRFEVDEAFAQRYPIQIVGSRTHEELWVPAEELSDFNAHIRGKIEVVAAFYGAEFRGEVDEKTNLPREISVL